MGRNRTALAPPGRIQRGVSVKGAEDLSEPTGKKSIITTAETPSALTEGLALTERSRFRGDQDTLLRGEEQ